MAFSVDAPFLKDILDQIKKGDIQLPDFQRGWVWDDPHISSLIASISLLYPIGAVMFLEAGGVAFKPRLFEGVSLAPAPPPKTFVMDGQQRLTATFLALKSGVPVSTTTEKGQAIERVYFLDMRGCMGTNGDREAAVTSIPASLKETEDFGRKVTRDLSTPELQYAQRMFPVSLLFDPAGYANWTMGYLAYHGHSPEESQFLMRFQQNIWLKFQEYRIPVIKLSADTPRVAVCQVFEKVNTGGVTLTVFELVTATFAADDFELRPDWESRYKRIIDKRPVLDGAIDGTAFLTAITLLSSYERSLTQGGSVSCKRADVLELALADYKRLADKVENSLRRVAELLAEQKIFDNRSLPYAAQLIPLAAIAAVLGDRLDQYPVKQKVLRWYWCGVFGELYGSANETRFGLDLPQVVKWIDGGVEPRTVADASFAPRRLLSLQSRLSAAYKGVAALLMKSGSEDFVTGTAIDLATYFDKAIDIHHIFPRVWCEANKLKRDKWNSVINKTPLAAATNRFIGGDAPSRYLERIEKNKGIERGKLDGFLSTHEIDSAVLRSDGFDAFLRNRGSRLLNLIEAATGKAVAGRDSEETLEAFGGPLLSVASSNVTTAGAAVSD